MLDVSLSCRTLDILTRRSGHFTCWIIPSFTPFFLLVAIVTHRLRPHDPFHDFFLAIATCIVSWKPWKTQQMYSEHV